MDKIKSTYNGWIGLLGWVTSGWNNRINAYQPWSMIVVPYYNDYRHYGRSVRLVQDLQ